MDDEKLIKLARKHVGEFSLSKRSLTAGSVCSALLAESGKVYIGICLDLACGIGFCAEHSAIAAMLLERQTVIRKIVAVSEERIMPPCGRCRELMLQIDRRNYDCVVIVDEGKSVLLRDLLPMPWQKVVSANAIHHAEPEA